MCAHRFALLLGSCVHVTLYAYTGLTRTDVKLKLSSAFIVHQQKPTVSSSASSRVPSMHNTIAGVFYSSSLARHLVSARAVSDAQQSLSCMTHHANMSPPHIVRTSSKELECNAKPCYRFQCYAFGFGAQLLGTHSCGEPWCNRANENNQG